MKRRSSRSGKPPKAGRRKTTASQRPNVRKAARPDRSPAAVVETKVAQLKRKLNEALEQQAATSEVLKTISSSTGELQPVFQTMLENATRLCAAKFGQLFLCEGDAFRTTAMHNVPPAYAEVRRRNPLVRPEPGSVLDRLRSSNRVVHIPDMTADQAYIERQPRTVAAVELGGFRAMVAVPMLKDGNLIGTFNIFRQEAGTFSDQHIELVQNFAAQAVIAIENTRLLNELRDSLERQTATSEVLKVISSSPGELKPVFNAMLENATRICEAKFGHLFLSEGDDFRAVAVQSAAPTWLKLGAKIVPLDNPQGPLAQLNRTKRFVHIADLTAEQAYIERNARMVALVESSGARTFLGVPMLKGDKLIGAISIYRQEVNPFTEKHIEFVQNFAAQAVIAIENTRLLSELRESLEQHTATAEVLKVISRSTFDLQTVLQTLVEAAARLCGADKAQILRPSDHEHSFYAAASYGHTAEYNDYLSTLIFMPSREGVVGRVLLERKPVQIEDVLADPDYRLTETQRLGGFRTHLGVPLLREGAPIGILVVSRVTVQPFDDKQLELLVTFADQAVIAIENTRLLDELNKLNHQLGQRVADQVGEIERMGRLRRFLPPQVADLIIASGAEKQLDSHRREITALFCDLRGFTGFSESSDPEDVMALLRDYHAAIGEIIIKYSGTLERYAGDGVMVVFNDPVPVDNPALQAVLMALEMRGAIGALTEKWRRLGHDIGFGIGIAHGFATLGTIGFEGRFDYAAIGTVSNVASRLCDEAKPGQILISPRVLMAVEKVVTVELVGEFALKGIRRPLAAHNVLAANSAA